MSWVTLRQNARQLVGVAVVAIVTLLGAAWYWLVEGFGVVDAVYQSVVTVSTVGFGETQPLDTSGRIFTIGLIVVGVTSMVYALGGFAEMLIESSIRRFTFRRKERTLERMNDHTIICGFGRTGAAVAQLLPKDLEYGVIEVDPTRADVAADAGAVALEGDCTLDETLLAAGVERAVRLIICLPSDSDAISTVLSAKVLNPSIRIVTRVSDAASAHKLRLAGAHQVVSPIEMGAQRLVADALEPSVGPFLDAVLHDESFGFSIRSVTVPSGSSSTTIGELEGSSGVRVVGVRDKAGHLIDSPARTESVVADQTIIVVGHRDELNKLQEFVSRSS